MLKIVDNYENKNIDLKALICTALVEPKKYLQKSMQRNIDQKDNLGLKIFDVYQ